MIENQMLSFKEPRLSHEQFQEVQKMYRKEQPKVDDKPCIVPTFKNGWRRLV